MDTIRSRKGSYHHGDLRNALVEAATELGRSGGPEAVVLREAARRVGVSPTAAYRHFSGHGDLLDAVKTQGQEALADFMQEAAREAEETAAANPGDAALRRVKALGRGYVRFALAEPGLFRTAFCHVPGPPAASAKRAEGVEGAAADAARNPAEGPPTVPAEGPPTETDDIQVRSFALLSEALDALTASGEMSAERRPGAEIPAWSTVHGLALLVIDGPLGRLEGPRLDTAIEATLDAIASGLRAPRG